MGLLTLPRHCPISAITSCNVRVEADVKRPASSINLVAASAAACADESKQRHRSCVVKK
jgi:hypothetical protein